VILAGLIVGERDRAAVVAECRNDPGVIGQVIDRALDVLAGGAIEELRNRLFQAVGQPSARRLDLRWGFQIGKLFGERLRTDDSAIEVRGDSIFLDQRDADDCLSLFLGQQSKIVWCAHDRRYHVSKF
jgi:hypothetical protein